MAAPIVDQVGEFFDVLFESIFSEPFRTRITDRLRRKAVLRQVDESADAASQSLMRFFLNEQLTPGQAAAVLSGFADLPNRLQLDDIANPNVTPESIVDGLLIDLPCPETVLEAGHEPVYRVSLHSIVQVLTLVGPVMAEWRKLNFSTTFELPRRIVRRLNEITFQLAAQAGAGEAAKAEQALKAVRLLRRPARTHRRSFEGKAGAETNEAGIGRVAGIRAILAEGIGSWQNDAQFQMRSRTRC